MSDPRKTKVHTEHPRIASLSTYCIEQEMQVYEQRHRTLFEQVSDAVYITTLDGRFVDINPAGLALFGYTRDEMMDLNVAQIYANPADRLAFKEDIGQSGKVRDYEVTFVRKDGTPRTCLLTASIWRDSHEQPVGYQGIIRDVTEQRRLEESVRSRHRTLQLLFSSMPNALLVVNPANVLEAFYLPADFPPVIDRVRIAENIPLRSLMPASLATAIGEAVQSINEWGADCSFDQPVIVGEQTYHLKLDIMHIIDLDNILIAIDDLTPLKEAETRAREYAAELEKRNQELDAYNHTIAHDLKHPLTALFLSLEVLADQEKDRLSEEGRQIMDVARERTLKACQMIDSLLMFARLRDASSLIEAVNMEDVVSSTLIRLEQPIQARGVAVEVSSPLSPVMGHAPWLEEVLANLIGNAIKYIGKDNPSPFIRIDCKRRGSMVRYEIIDNGVGISEENTSRLFEKFSRFHHMEADGLGLGLSIVQGIISKLGGTVGVESEVGKGSTFWFELPASSE